MFSKALLTATYKNGVPGQLTKEHEKAERHRFKREFLFKNKKIPKDLYLARLIQHHLIIQALEKQLQNLPHETQAELNPFFALTYLEQLWRTPNMEKDLKQLGFTPQSLKEKHIAQSTKAYLQHIEHLPPKALLAHFLLHVAGFMHGGRIICSRYINPSNELTSYTISAHQYDFSSAASKLSGSGVYPHLMSEVDKIPLNTKEYDNLLSECTGVYETMTHIYDDLCDMHAQQPLYTYRSLAYASVCIAALGFIVNQLFNYFNPASDVASPRPN